MKEQVKITIITISYNSEKTIEETIKSVISQKYDNLEYIIIDGCSTDKTMDIVNKYRARIATIISEKDNGISDAFNKGVRAATGELICMINSDDLMNEDAAQIIANAYEKDIDIYYGDVISVDQYKNVIRRRPRKLERFIYSQPIYHQSTYISKNAYKKFGLYDTNLKMAMDYELLYKMYLGGAKFRYVDKALSTFSLQGLSGSNELKNAKAVYNVSTRCGTSKIRAILYLIRSYITHYLKLLFKGKFVREMAYKITDRI